MKPKNFKMVNFKLYYELYLCLGLAVIIVSVILFYVLMFTALFNGGIIYIDYIKYSELYFEVFLYIISIPAITIIFYLNCKYIRKMIKND